MKLLCLHGAYGNSESTRNLLFPLIEAFEDPKSVQLEFVDGSYAAPPPTGLEDYFGPPPHFRFFEPRDAEGFVHRIKEIPLERKPEDTVRNFIDIKAEFCGPSMMAEVNRLMNVINQDPEITGVLGFSEGSVMASALILEEHRRAKDENRPRQLKCAIFMGGWPPIHVKDGCVNWLLADECEDIINIPTCHILGHKDPFLHLALSLYNMCDEDKAVLFEHGQGHLMPRDTQTMQELAPVIEAMCRQVSACK